MDIPLPENQHQLSEQRNGPLKMTLIEILHLKNSIAIELERIVPNFSVRELVDVLRDVFDIEKLILIHKKLQTTGSDSPFVREIEKILKTKNQLINLDTQPIGLETSIMLYAAKAQHILDFKHLSSKSNCNLPVKNIPVGLNSTVLFAGKNHAWFRVRLAENRTIKSVLDSLKKLNISHDLYEFPKTDICEIIITRDRNEISNYLKIMNVLNTDDCIEHVLFYSNLRLVLNQESSYTLALSCIFKFYYCYTFNYNDTILDKAKIDDCFKLQLHCHLLAQKVNFNTNRGGLLQPLNQLSGEKCTPSLRSKKNKVFYSGGPRDGLFMGYGTQIGGKTKTEVEIGFNY